MKQVTYFEATYQGGIAKHYTKDTEDFNNWVSTFKSLDPETEVIYIAYSDGTTEGQAV